MGKNAVLRANFIRVPAHIRSALPRSVRTGRDKCFFGTDRLQA